MSYKSDTSEECVPPTEQECLQKILIRVYVTSKVSGVTDEERSHLSELKAAVVAELRKQKALVAQCIGEFTRDNDIVCDYDIRCVGQCNLLIILAEYPSLGLGIEMKIANDSRKVVLALARPDAIVSHFIHSGPSMNKYFVFNRYHGLNDVAALVNSALASVRGQLSQMFS